MKLSFFSVSVRIVRVIPVCSSLDVVISEFLRTPNCAEAVSEAAINAAEIINFFINNVVGY